jgi:predicted MFS family arabinose efflux permease
MSWSNIRRLSLPGLTRDVMLYLIFSAVFHFGLMGIGDTVLNFYFVSLGYGSETIGLLQSLPRLGGFLLGLPSGLLANRIGSRRITIYATMCMAFTYATLIIWPTLFMVGLSRFLLGFFFGIVQIAVNPLLVALSPTKYETHVFAYSNVVSMGAIAIGSVVGGFLPLLAANTFPEMARRSGDVVEQSTFAYQVTLAIGGLVIFVSILTLLRLNHKDIIPATTLGAELRGIPFRKLSGLSFPLLVFGFTGGLTFPFYNLFFRTSFDLSDQAVGAVLSLGWLGMALVPLANPWWERNHGRVWGLGATMTIAAIGFTGLSAAPTLAISIGFFIIAISFRNVMQPLFQPLIMSTLPTYLHNMASSIGLILWNIGWFSATAVSGVWQAQYGFGFIMRVVAIGLIINAISIILIYRNQSTFEVEKAFTGD